MTSGRAGTFIRWTIRQQYACIEDQDAGGRDGGSDPCRARRSAPRSALRCGLRNECIDMVGTVQTLGVLPVTGPWRTPDNQAFPALTSVAGRFRKRFDPQCLDTAVWCIVLRTRMTVNTPTPRSLTPSTDHHRQATAARPAANVITKAFPCRHRRSRRRFRTQGAHQIATVSCFR